MPRILYTFPRLLDSAPSKQSLVRVLFFFLSLFNVEGNTANSVCSNAFLIEDEQLFYPGTSSASFPTVPARVRVFSLPERFIRKATERRCRVPWMRVSELSALSLVRAASEARRRQIQ